MNNRKFLQGRNSYYMSCFEFVNLFVDPLHSCKYTQWNEVEARVDDFIQNYFILGAFVHKRSERVYSPEGALLKRVHTGRYLLPLGRDFTS